MEKAGKIVAAILCVRAGVRDILGHEGGWEGVKRDHHQQQAIEEEQKMVFALDVPEQPVMVEPHDQNRPEARDVGQQRRPQRQQCRRQPAVRQGVQLGHMDVQRQQRDSDGEHAVAERLHAGSFFFGSYRRPPEYGFNKTLRRG